MVTLGRMTLSEQKDPISKLEHKQLPIDRTLIKICCLGFLIEEIETNFSNIPISFGRLIKTREDWSSTFKYISASTTSTQTCEDSTLSTTAVRWHSRSIWRPEHQRCNLTKISSFFSRCLICQSLSKIQPLPIFFRKISLPRPATVFNSSSLTTYANPELHSKAQAHAR